MLLRHNITGIETARSASIMHSNPAKLNPVSTVVHGRLVANTSPALCISAAWVKFCLNCSKVDQQSALAPYQSKVQYVYIQSLTCARREASGVASMQEISCLQSLSPFARSTSW